MKAKRKPASILRDNARRKYRKKPPVRTAEEKLQNPTSDRAPISHPISREVYSDEETAWLMALDAYQRRTGRKFLAACEYLLILKSLGYHKS